MDFNRNGIDMVKISLHVGEDSISSFSLNREDHEKEIHWK